MSEPVDLDRRTFTLQAALAALAGVSITISGCGGGSSSPAAPRTGTPGTNTADHNAVISANHGHAAKVTAAQLTAAGALSLNIQGSATHPHMLELSVAEVQQIGAGRELSKECASGDADNHRHLVTFGSSEPAPGYNY